MALGCVSDAACEEAFTIFFCYFFLVWYGIGMLYERCGSYEHAEEAFTGVLKMDPNSDKKTDILFRLGTIYKQTQKYPQVYEHCVCVCVCVCKCVCVCVCMSVCMYIYTYIHIYILCVYV